MTGVGVYWLIVALVGVLLFTNVREAVSRYIADQDKARLFTYLIPLLVIGYLVVHVTFRIIDLANASDQQDSGASDGVRYASRKSLFGKKAPLTALQTIDR